MISEMNDTIKILEKNKFKVTQENERSILAENDKLIGAFTVQIGDITGSFFIKSYKPILLEAYKKEKMKDENSQIGWTFYKNGTDKNSCRDSSLDANQLEGLIARAQKYL